MHVYKILNFVGLSSRTIYKLTRAKFVQSLGNISDQSDLKIPELKLIKVVQITSFKLKYISVVP